MDLTQTVSKHDQGIQLPESNLSTEQPKNPWIYYTDRSRILSYQECPRLRFLAYEINPGNLKTRAGGITRKAAAIPLIAGQMVHEGLALLMTWAMHHPGDLKVPEDVVDVAAAHAVDKYREEASRRGLAIEFENEDIQYTAEEQMALIEALIRSYAAIRMPHMLEQYRVIEVEMEDELGLYTDPDTSSEPVWPAIVLMTRADALLEETTGEPADKYVMSFKTAARWDVRHHDAAQFDVQGLTEPAAIENRLGERVEGVQMDYLIKGDRRSREDEFGGDGRYVTLSYLIRPYKCAAPTPELDRYAAKYVRRKDWRAVEIWKDIGVKEWIQRLVDGHESVEMEMDFWDKVFVANPPYRRAEGDRQRIIRQITEQEKVVRLRAESINEDLANEEYESDYIQRLLDMWFPQHRNHCTFPVKCIMRPICHGSIPLTQLLDEQQFISRTPHHTPELVQIQNAQRAAGVQI